jgi:transcriptional regulator with XRE-family HTH domain
MILDYRTPDEIVTSLGEKVRARRIHLGLDQVTVAARAGVSPRAWRDLEHGAGSSLDTFVRAAKALGFSEGLDALIAPPKPTVSPMTMLAASAQPVQRVRRKR